MILANAFDGYNCSLMAYGQTGAGKSFSMMGGAEVAERGIIPRVCSTLFERSQSNEDPHIHYNVEVSYLEIYSERIRDLLNPKNSKAGGLRVREHPQTGFFTSVTAGDCNCQICTSLPPAKALMVSNVN